MRSWILMLLLAALLTIRLQLGNAEGDPLPPSLVDLVRNSPVSSVDDLKILLQQETNAIEDEEDEHDTLPNYTPGRHTRSIVDAEPAKKAECTVRTEVMEITRSMLDRRSVNFIPWPPCVEVQRCSGCCNSRFIKCVPSVTSSRYLQVLKIMYKEGKSQYETVVITVEDHVRCMCKHPSSASSSTVSIPHSTSQSNPNPLPPPPQKPPLSPHIPVTPPRPAHPTSPKTHASKADLHRHDDLKHNQQHRLLQEQEPVARQWQQGGYTQLVRWTQPRVNQPPTHVQTGVHQTVTGMIGSVSIWPSEARAEPSMPQAGHGSGYDRSREESSVHISNGGGEVHADHEQRQQQLLQHQQRLRHQHHHQYHQQFRYPQQYNQRGAEGHELRRQYWLNSPQSDSASSPASFTQLPRFEENSTPLLSAIQKDSETTQGTDKQTETEKETLNKGNNVEESGSTVSGDSAGSELASQREGKYFNRSGEEGHLTEGERRQKIGDGALEMGQSEPDKPSLLHPPQRPKAGLVKTGSSTAAPRSASVHQTPFRPASPPRRRRPRKRMSKRAMRAKLQKEMV
uniref:Platelet-derived growth factor beta polypeptide n=1 Tax=Nothobranchius kuhntae TaxID=321403 RepID=A0A1A8K4K5_NOTKU